MPHCEICNHSGPEVEYQSCPETGDSGWFCTDDRACHERLRAEFERNREPLERDPAALDDLPLLER